MKALLIVLFSLISIFSYAENVDSLKLGNACLYYYTSGQGEPIVVLAGGPGIDSHQEDDLAKSLSGKYRVILFDQRGTGKSWTSPFDSTTINIDTAIHDIEILRNHLKIKKLTIAGHSWGAMLASYYAATYPQNVKSLLLICGGELDTTMTQIVNTSIDARFQLGDTTSYYYWSDSVNFNKDPVKGKYELRKITWSMLIYDRQKLSAVMEQASHGAMNNTTKCVDICRVLNNRKYFTQNYSNTCKNKNIRFLLNCLIFILHQQS
jgi:proline iminopeptidase